MSINRISNACQPVLFDGIEVNEGILKYCIKLLDTFSGMWKNSDAGVAGREARSGLVEPASGISSIGGSGT